MSKRPTTPPGPFSVILADPPWNYRTWSKKGAGRTASSHYDVMPVDDIGDLPVAALAAAECSLYMWITAPNALEGFRVLDCWGFKFATFAFTWAKRELRPIKRIKVLRDYKAGRISEAEAVDLIDRVGWHKGNGHTTRANAEFVVVGRRGDRAIPRLDKGVGSLIVAPRGEHSAKPIDVHQAIEQLHGDIPRVELFARRPAPGWITLGNEIDGKPMDVAIRDVLAARR